MARQPRSPGGRRPAGGPQAWLVIAVAAALAWLYWRADQPPSCEGPPLPAVPGSQPVPRFTAQALDGRTVTFPDGYAGKLVLLDFWATWCPPCRAEFTHLVAAYERFGDDGLEIVGISLDAGRGVDRRRVQRFLDRAAARWPVIYDDAERIAAAFGVDALPTALLIDGTSGAVLARGHELRGTRLATTLERFFATRRTSGAQPPTGTEP